MNGRAAGWLGAVACAGVAGVVALAVACIPDLPPAQPTADGGDDADEIPGCGDGIVDLDAEQCDPGVPIDPDATFAGCKGTCQMDCPGGFVWPANNHCYVKAGNRQPSQQVAAYQCTQNGTHLVTFASEQEFEQVAGRIDAGPFWVGLLSNFAQPNTYTAAQLFEPGWSPTCSGCFAHTDDASVPLVGPPNTGCVEAFSYVDASWRQYPCNNSPEAGKPLYVICEREPRGTTARPCSGGICFEIPATYGLKRYLYVGKPAAADQARQTCAAQGGGLVVLQSSEEREQIWYELSRVPSLNLLSQGEFWIGLSLGDGSAWVWDDGTLADAYPSPWANGQPNVQEDTTNAYLSQNASSFDTTLASTNAPSTPKPYLCQIPLVAPDAGDAGEAGTEDASDAGVTE